ncbi:tetratricopeptide repeat protein [Virgibacillus sp. LDC-1]|uniref:tetratricopeptide repeat protein n=1 Tax=Virgibacillus sp. LDC-1 TaxID=3039856 RepID=UPI0024DE0152|nr:tetratricopeptide repeat protein [Virgibacillus sp. LDC-1]
MNGTSPNIQAIEALLQTTTDRDKQFFALSTIANHYRKTHHYDKAVTYFKQALLKVNECPTINMAGRIELILNYAELERAYGHFKEARILLAKLLEQLEKKEPDNLLAFGYIYRNLGSVFIDEGDFENGIIQFEKAITYFKQIVSATHPLTVRVMHTLIDVYVQAENYNEAINRLEWLSTAYEKINDTSSVAQIQLKIAEIYFFSNMQLARKKLLEVLTLFERLSLQSDLDFIRINMMLGELDENMGAFTRASLYYQEACKGISSHKPPIPYLVAYINEKIGKLSLLSGDLQQAEIHYKKGLIVSNNFSLLRLQTLLGLVEIYTKTKNDASLVNIHHQILHLLSENNQKNTITFVNSLIALGDTHYEQGKTKDAISYYVDAIHAFSTLASSHHEKQGIAILKLATCYEKKSNPDFRKAEAAYRQSIELLRKTNNYTLLKEAYRLVISFYKRRGIAEEIRSYQMKLTQLDKTC